MANGYLHSMYAKSLSEFGNPMFLPSSLSWVLKRNIFAFSDKDAIGCYPLFFCQHWPGLKADLKEIRNDLISLAVVTDPFGGYDEQYLRECFRDIVFPYKEHYITDLKKLPVNFIDSHHQRNVKKGLRETEIEICHEPIVLFEEWKSLYKHLIQKHNIQGMAAFSEEAFKQQLQIPGIIAFRALFQNKTVGITLWYLQDDIGYYHLGAYSDIGYQVRASYAIFWTAIKHFADCKFQWLSLGAGAGILGKSADGLNRFKKGWATGTRTAYFCGQIFDNRRYQEIVKSMSLPENVSFFPAYRYGDI
jgi:hypothetical protein